MPPRSMVATTPALSNLPTVRRPTSLCSIQVSRTTRQEQHVAAGVGVVEGHRVAHRRASAALAVLVQLVGDEGGAAGAGSDIHQDLEAHRHARIDLGAAKQAEASRGIRVVEAVVGPGHVGVIPPQNRPVDLTGDGQRHLTVALAGRGGFELGNPLFEVCTAVATKVCRPCGAGSQAEQYNLQARGAGAVVFSRRRCCFCATLPQRLAKSSRHWVFATHSLLSTPE